MPRRSGGTRRKKRTHKKDGLSSDRDKTPRSVVIRRGAIPTSFRDLIPDIRTMLMPHTARKLKERKSNSLRDFVNVSGHLGITHLWLLSATQRAPYLRIARSPQGPTLTFRVAEYSLVTDVRHLQRRPVSLVDGDLAQPPLLVLNNFSAGEPHVSLMGETFRHSFPPIDVAQAKLADLRRVFLINRDPESGLVHLRHYQLKVAPAGLSRPVRKMIAKRRVPKLSALADVSQMMDDAPGIFSSDSEMEETGDNTVRLVQGVQKVKRDTNSSIRLVEIGPRLTLQLVKIQAGFCDGAVLFHGHVCKSAEETIEDEKRIGDRNALKRKRRENQEENVRRKQEVKKAKKERHKKNTEMRIDAEEKAALEAMKDAHVNGNEADEGTNEGADEESQAD